MAGTATNKVKFGLSNVHYAVATVSEAGAVTYGNWSALPNGISLTTDSNTNTSTQYADNVLVYEGSTVTSTTLELELTVIPKAFLTDILGYKVGSDGGLVQPAGAITKKIALWFEMDGDVKKSRVCYFLCSVSDVPGENAQTKTESITFANKKLNLTAYPVKIGTAYYLKTTYEDGDTGYATLAGNTAYTLPTIS